MQAETKNTEIVLLTNTPILCPIIDGQPYVVVKSIIDGIGLNYQNSMKNLGNSPLNKFKIEYKLSEEFEGLVTGKTYFALPVRKIAAWLYSINAEKVNERAREQLSRFQTECDEILFQHFFGNPALEHPFFQEKTRLTIEHMQLKERETILRAEINNTPAGIELAEIERKQRRIRKSLRKNDQSQNVIIQSSYQKSIE